MTTLQATIILFMMDARLWHGYKYSVVKNGLRYFSEDYHLKILAFNPTHTFHSVPLCTLLLDIKI